MSRAGDASRIVLLTTAAWLLPLTLLAQYVTTGGLIGRVIDDSGAGLAGVSVTLAAADVDQPYRAATGADGSYRFIDVVPRTYTLTAERQRSLAGPVAVEVRAGSLRRVDLKLASRQFESQIEVTGRAPQIETVTSQVNSYVTLEEIRSLPLENRQFLDALAIVPGVTRGVPTGSYTDRGPRNSFSFHGARTNQNDFLLDGAANNDKSDLNYEDIGGVQILGGPRTGPAGAAGATFQVGTALQPYNLDAVQEVQVATSLFSAELGGGGSGGVINVVTRSGADVPAGSITLQQQRDAWVAGSEHQDIRRTIGAAALGGPIVKGKAHYFGTYERDDHVLGFDFGAPSYFVPDWTRGLGLDANHTTRDQVTFKVGNRFTDAHNLTATANYVDERADVLQTTFRERQRSDAVPERYRNRSLGLVLRDLAVVGSEGDGTLESMVDGARVDRTFDSADDAPREAFNFYFPDFHVYAVGGNSPDSDNRIDTFGLSEKLSLATDRTLSAFGAGVDDFRQRSHQAEYLSLSHFPELGFSTYVRYPVTDLAASVTDAWGFAQTDWFLNPGTTLNLGLRLERDDLVRDLAVEPRIGIAFDPGGDGRQVLRAGGGVYHDRANLIGVTGALRPPLESGQVVDGALVPTGVPSVVEVDPDLVLPTVYKLALGYQRRLGARTVAGATLFANLSRDLFYSDRRNRPDRDGNRPDPTLGETTFYGNFGFSDVYDLELELRHRFDNGSTLRASYTYEHSRGNSVFDFISANDPINRGTDYAEQMATYEVSGPLSSEIEHQLKVSGVFILPLGLQLSAFLDWNSGRPYYWYTVWYELPSFFPHYDIVGGYNRQRIGATFDADVRIAKSFRVGRSSELTLYLDAFNVTDRRNVLERYPLYALNYGAPVGEPGTTYYPDWKKATLYGPRRSLELGARLSF